MSLQVWQIPELDERRQPVPTVPPTVADSGADDPPARSEISADAPLAPGEQHPPELNPAAELVAEQIARGYADGWERGLSEGREKGYADGAAAGRKAAAALDAQAQRLGAIIAQLGGPIPALDAAVEEAVAALALEVARQVIGSEISRSRDYLVQLIRQAIAQIPIETGALKVVLNPADLEIIRTLAPQIENAGAVLVGDEAIEPGDCRVVTEDHGVSIKDKRWRPRPGAGVSQVELCLASRWRAVMDALFEGEDK